MAINTLYMVRLLQTWGVGGRSLENVFFYDRTAGTGNSEVLGDLLNTGLIPLINNVQASKIQNKSFEIVNMGDFTDFTSYLLEGEGSFTGDVLPPYSALGFTFKLNTREVRHGSKRIAGIPESIQADGLINNTGYRDNRELLRVFMQQEVVGASDTFLPVVVKRVRTAVSGTTPTQYTYRLPRTDGELVLGEVVSVLTSDILSHQVSRKV